MSTTLVLVPTELERLRLRRFTAATVVPELCGFGPIAAAARTAALIAEREPRRIALIGIAGTFDAARLPVGRAGAFGRVVQGGLGVDDPGGFLGPRELGLPQVAAADGREDVYDELRLWLPRRSVPCTTGALLTHPTASADARQADARQKRWPGALAEDMEAFGVALAAHATGTPLLVVRGASNLVGERDTSNWKIDEALRAAAELLGRALDVEWSMDEDRR
ncbi:Futalosine hydrolase [Planctomycetes bacterium Pla163]|uniref:Futalosine hydrolase n=1 Tax=Rohdeia mirabilis TaxID=2528008 RepID=A0A518D1U5_9BACT|nr:Futalosine hydrolase [Planctomycetes bacterium Pla163]